MANPLKKPPMPRKPKSPFQSPANYETTFDIDGHVETVAAAAAAVLAAHRNAAAAGNHGGRHPISALPAMHLRK